MKYCSIPVTHYQQNCSLLWCEKTKQAAVVDPGGDVHKIVAAIEERGLTLVKIFLTHGHMDHVGGTSELKSLIDVPVIGPHEDDLFWIDGLDKQAAMMGFAEVEGFRPNQWLTDGDTVRFGECELAVKHCPGHTPGHVVFYHEGTQMAFVGDVLFKGSVGRTDFPRGNHDQLVNSIRGNLFPLGDEVRFVPGHGPESTFGYEKQYNPFVADTRFG